MTKKDFELIAETLKGLSYITGGIDKRLVIGEFARALQSTNPRFDMERFSQACMTVKESAVWADDVEEKTGKRPKIKGVK